MLTGRKGMAKVSQTPGKTQLLNFFLINQHWYLVDLPGYGYAKVSKSQQKNLSGMIESYLQERQTLLFAFVLIDVNIPPSKTDLKFLAWLGERAIPFALVFTKADRLGTSTIHQNVSAFQQAMLEQWESLPPHFVTSSVYRTGRSELLDYIGSSLGHFSPPKKA